MNNTVKEWGRRILVLCVVILFVGLVGDALSGFPVIRQAGSVIGGIGALFVFGLLYLSAEGIMDWVDKTDKPGHPLWRRVLNLVALLLTMVLIGGVFYYVLRYI